MPNFIDKIKSLFSSGTIPTNQKKMRLLTVLANTKEFVSRSTIEGWPCEEPSEVKEELERMIAHILNPNECELPKHCRALFSVAEPLQEIAISNSWHDQYLEFAAEYDQVENYLDQIELKRNDTTSQDNLTIIAQRTSVCAADDCRAPNEKQFYLPTNADLEELLSVLQTMKYLPVRYKWDGYLNEKLVCRIRNTPDPMEFIVSANTKLIDCTDALPKSKTFKIFFKG